MVVVFIFWFNNMWLR